MRIKKRIAVTVALVMSAYAFLLMAGCSRQEQKWPNIQPSPGARQIRIESVTLDKVSLDSVYCSGIGFSCFTTSLKICYFDRYLGYLYSFDIDGTFLDRKYGLGRGPGEVIIENPFGFYLDEAGDLTLLGNGLDVETHSARGDRDYFMIAYQQNGTDASNDYSTYTHSIMPEVHTRGDSEILYCLFCENPNFNMLNHTAKFLEEAYHLAVIDKNTHEGKVIVKGFPSKYYESPYQLFAFSYIHYDLLPGSDKMLVSFEGTPELYLCDSMGRPQHVFGSPGKDMDLDYLPVNSFEADDVKNFRRNRETKGYYGPVKVHGRYVFRSYKKGAVSSSDGLQIYEDEVLIADLDVPKDFCVIGVSGKKVISNIQFDEEAELLYCYEFEME